MNNTGHEFWEKTKYQYAHTTKTKIRSEKPPLEKEHPPNSRIIDLPKPEKITIPPYELREAIEQRTSIRQYNDKELSLEELSYLLWCTQGVKEVIPKAATFRTVPSAGARHAFETYLLINNVQGIESGIYRFLAISHTLLFIASGTKIADRITDACLGQKFVMEGAVTFFWVAEITRMTWRYGERGYRYILLDAGHVCQNLYLSAESLNCGVCAIAAYQDDDLNKLLELDGINEFVVYIASLGKKEKAVKALAEK